MYGPLPDLCGQRDPLHRIGIVRYSPYTTGHAPHKCAQMLAPRGPHGHPQRLANPSVRIDEIGRRCFQWRY